MPTNNPADPIAFDAKATQLIEATQHLSIPHILMARRMTLSDPESLKWASPRQLNVVFDVVLNKALAHMERIDLLSAVDQDLEPLLPPPAERSPEDHEILSKVVTGFLAKSRTPSKKLSEAEQVIASFEKLLSRRLPPTPPSHYRTGTPFREAVPLFAAQGGLRATSAALKAPPKPNATPEELAEHHAQTSALGHPVDFATLFDDTICAHLKAVFEQLQVPPNYENPLARPRLPYLLAPEFEPVFIDVTRRFILPQMKASRQVKALASAYNWAQVGGEQLIEIMHGSEINNPVLHNWDMAWNNYKGLTQKGKNNPWNLFNEDATNCNYDPPDCNNLRLILDVIRYEPDAMAKCWRELQNLAQQEFSPSGRQERARDGALRDGILKWSAKLPDCVGEFVAIKAAFILPACTTEYMRALVNNFGRSEQERRRNAPYLSQFVADMRG